MRSLLFVPGHDPRKLAKAMTCGADALILDLADSVAPASKAPARQMLRDFIFDARRRSQRPRLFVRINGLETGLAGDASPGRGRPDASRRRCAQGQGRQSEERCRQRDRFTRRQQHTHPRAARKSARRTRIAIPGSRFSRPVIPHP
jgi:hypothetical protein